MLAVVLDADNDEFVATPGTPAGTLTTALAISHDGTHVLFRARVEDQPEARLVLHTVATGEQRSFDAHRDGTDWKAALSPDGRAMATLGGDDDSAIVALTDTGTGVRRRLWSSAGLGSALECSIAWSPDGRLVATTYVDDEGHLVTMVLDTADESGHILR
ncbi:TolB family protein [Embleya sp. NPDC056575]|uniref:TolB family protein n=1 Tax=unclassified Embleya TaxID=2699296 RepID=UPI0036CA93BB